MIRHLRLEHRFVDFVPERLDPGVLYVSMGYATAAHSCCCGCGEEIVTPFTPTDWKMTYDGETISLSPSVGNWHQRCRSHYVINRGRVIEAGPWDEEQVAAERRRDQSAKAAHYATSQPVFERPPEIVDTASRPSLGARLNGFVSWIFGRG